MPGEVEDRPADLPQAGGTVTLPGIALLDAIRSNTDDPGRALLGALVASGQGDGGAAPHVDLLMRLIGGQGDAEAGRQALRDELRDEIRAEEAEAVANLAETARRLFAEREETRALLEALAAALGACPDCFGEDALCPTCHGAGQPGARAPEPEAFRQYVLPALRHARPALRRAAARRPWPPPGERIVDHAAPHP